MKYISLVDDHVLLRQGLASLINSFNGYKVLFEADNGKHFIEQLKPNVLPDIVLMDITMPEMDGFETTSWLRTNHPSVKVLVLSMMDNETAVIRMLKCGAKGYLLKNTKPTELSLALDEISKKGFYFNEMVSSRIVHVLNSLGEDPADELKRVLNITDREEEFLKLCCTEMSYKEIAEAMSVSPRTIDGYRDKLFEKLELKTRVGLAMFAIKNGIVAVS